MKNTLAHSPRPLRRASHGNVVTSVAFAPDGETLASGSWDGTIKLWDVRGGKLAPRRTLRGEWDEVEAIAFAPDGSVAGLGTGWDGTPFGAVTVWAPGASRGLPLLRVADKLDAIAFAPDGATLATASADSRTVTLWDVATGRERETLPDHRGPVWSVAFSPDGRTFAAASGAVPAVADRDGDPQPGAIRLWDLAGPGPRRRVDLVGHAYGIVSVAFAPGGATLASGGFDCAAKLWDVAAAHERATLEGHGAWVASVAFSPDGSALATGSHDQAIKLWDAATGRELATLEGHTGNVYSVAFSPDGTLLASGSLDGSVKIWDVEAHRAGRPPDPQSIDLEEAAR
ncbi:WD40 repeat domain-containing protein [Tautonia plasticadhaerens]|uniref:Translocation protein TolB n=1 Tax=Tautonia plasticadhaerens TaxID=2527974 RepID=A0A518HA00_9BACT|nr:WD40 repeat domain-containing protein [Tautonia plasticadhaerens]QDV37627.1 translocation protein TolB [Tautonia plasticadhaerens]